MSAVIVDAHRKPRSAATEALVALWRVPHIRACMIVLLLYLLVAVLGYAHLLPDHEASVGDAQEPPSLHLARLLGTDILGRSVLWRVLAGAQTAVTIGLVTTALAVPFGTALGLAAGYFGGWVDNILMRFTDVVYAFPSLVLLIVLVTVFARNGDVATRLTIIMVATALTGWGQYARVLRSEILKVKNLEYVDAARALGTANGRIILRHVLPNSLTSLLVLVSLDIGTTVVTFAALSFLGIGAPSGFPDWGQLINLSRDWITQPQYWFTWFYPGVTIIVFVLGWNMFGDALRDALDPRSR